MSHNNQNPSNATLAGFSAGYRIADAALNAADKVADSTKEAAVAAREVANKVAGSTKDAAVATGHTVVGFFSGLRYAVTARRGTKVVEPKKVEDPEAKRREREELWRRVHGVQSEVATSRRAKTSGRAVRRAK